jgi:hypothetical protein
MSTCSFIVRGGTNFNFMFRWLENLGFSSIGHKEMGAIVTCENFNGVVYPFTNFE